MANEITCGTGRIAVGPSLIQGNDAGRVPRLCANFFGSLMVKGCCACVPVFANVVPNSAGQVLLCL